MDTPEDLKKLIIKKFTTFIPKLITTMKPFAFLTSTLVCLLFSAKLFAQDYLITANGDTIKCRISISITGKAKYQTKETAKPQKITVEDVKEFFLADDSTTFRAVYLNAEKVFMKMLEKGKIDIYESIYYNTSYMNGNGISTVSTYILKTTDTVQDLKYHELPYSNKKCKLFLEPILVDNKAVYDKFIADDKFSFKAIRNIVHLYNTGMPFKERIKLPKKKL